MGSIATALLTRMTFVEVSRLRPARWREAFKGLFGLSFRLAFAELVIAGNTLLILELLRVLPRYFVNSEPVAGIEPALTATVAAIIAMVAEVLQWPVFALSFLLAPILTVESCSIGTALLQWLRLVRRQFGRAFVYEAIALGIGLVITLPLYFPLMTFVTIYPEPKIHAAVVATRTSLQPWRWGRCSRTSWWQTYSSISTCVTRQDRLADEYRRNKTFPNRNPCLWRDHRPIPGNPIQFAPADRFRSHSRRT